MQQDTLTILAELYELRKENDLLKKFILNLDMKVTTIQRSMEEGLLTPMGHMPFMKKPSHWALPLEPSCTPMTMPCHANSSETPETPDPDWELRLS